MRIQQREYLVSFDKSFYGFYDWLFLEVIAVQPELELIWQEFESASTYVYAQHEALTKIDRSEQNDSRFLKDVFLCLERLWRMKSRYENLGEVE